VARKTLHSHVGVTTSSWIKGSLLLKGEEGKERREGKGQVHREKGRNGKGEENERGAYF